MGCVGSKKTEKQSPQLPVTHQPLVSKPVVSAIASAPQIHSNGPNNKYIQNPQEAHNDSKVQPEANAQQNNDDVSSNKSGRPNWKVQQAAQPTISRVNQSPIFVVYSSDPKQQVHGLNNPAVEVNPQDVNLINTIKEVPSFMEGDSRKISAPNSQNPYKNEQKVQRVQGQQQIPPVFNQFQISVFEISLTAFS